MFVSGGCDRLIRVWDKRAPGDSVRALEGHQGEINGVEFAFDASASIGKIYSVGADRALKMWHMDGSDCRYFDSYFGHTSAVRCMDLMTLARPVTGGDDFAVRSWNLNRDTHQLFSSGGHTAPVDSVHAQDSAHYLSGGEDGLLCLWGSTARKALFARPDAHSGKWVTAVSGIRGTDVAVSGSSDGLIKFWRIGRPTDNASKKTKMVIDAMPLSIPIRGVVNDIAVSQNGQLAIAAVGRDHKHGRWIVAPEAKNGLMFVRINHDAVDKLSRSQ